MTKRLALTPAVGLFAGLSVVSYGAMSMLLTGVHGTRPASTASTTSCSSASATRAATAVTKAMVRSAAHAGAQARPAGMPVLLSDTVRLAVIGQSSPPLPSTQPSPSASSPSLPQPSPGSSAAPGPSGLPQPGPATTTQSKQPLTPGGTLKSPNASATPTSTVTATPTTTPTTPPPGTLCMTMQTLNGVSAVDPHTKIGYAIWIWLTSGTNGTARIKLSARPNGVSPTFSVCSTTGRSSCTVGGLSAGQHVEVQAKLAAPNRPAKRVTLTATATSAQASNSASASATVDIKPKNQPNPTLSPTPNPNAGYGGTLPAGQALPGGTTIPGLGIQPTGDLGSAFPQVSPSVSLPGAAGAARHGHTTRTIDLSAGLPLDVRLIGGQVIGLAVLAAAVTIAVARMSLRRQPARHGDDGGTSS